MSQLNHADKDPSRRSRRWGGAVALGAIALAVLPLACESATAPVPGGEEPALDPPPAVLQGIPNHAAVLLERAWGGDRMWEMLKPRPPGLGTPEEQTVPFYVLAPVIAGDPLSPPAEIPGVLRVGGRDHVVPTPAGNGGPFRAVARTVALEHPGWEPAPLFGPAQCDNVVHDDRVAWAWVEVAGLTEGTGHPCGRIAVVFAVQLDGESCPMPITNLERVHEAIDQGLVNASRPPEPAWPVAIRPMTEQGTGRTAQVAPNGCVPGGERTD
jgi:hypothetical protein